MTASDFVVDKTNLEVRMTRIFDAPRELVWKTIMDPSLVSKWWGPYTVETTVEIQEPKVGGKWRYLCSHAGQSDAFSGVYMLIDPPNKVTRTFNYEPIGPGHELVETAILEVVEGNKTKLTSIAKYTDIRDLEGMVASGMEQGERESWDRLEKLVSIG